MNPQHVPATAAEMLATLRADGAERFDPIGFHAIEVLSRRTQAASGDVQRLLEQRLQARLEDLRDRLALSRAAAGEEFAQPAATHPDRAAALRRLHDAGDYAAMRRLATASPVDARRTLLATLNARLRETDEVAAEAASGAGIAAAVDQRIAASIDDPFAATNATTGRDPDTGATRELRSLRRFRQAWSRISAEDRLHRALGREPANAGPLNSHMLVLRALAAMRQLSPDYLRRMLEQMDTLLWLEARQQGAVPATTKPARRGRQRK
jgi:hypothetical protein